MHIGNALHNFNKTQWLWHQKVKHTNSFSQHHQTLSCSSDFLLLALLKADAITQTEAACPGEDGGACAFGWPDPSPATAGSICSCPAPCSGRDHQVHPTYGLRWARAETEDKKCPCTGTAAWTPKQMTIFMYFSQNTQGEPWHCSVLAFKVSVVQTKKEWELCNIWWVYNLGAFLNFLN